jgi:hypothetical protein
MTTIRKYLADMFQWLANRVRPAGGGGPGTPNKLQGGGGPGTPV